MDQSTMNKPGQLLRLPEVLKHLSISRTSWYDSIKLGLYPEPVRLGKRTVAWRESDIEALSARRLDAARARGNPGGSSAPSGFLYRTRWAPGAGSAPAAAAETIAR